MGKNSPDNSDTRDANALAQTIEHAKQELQHMIDMNPQVMLLVDDTGTIMRTNRALLDLLGVTDFQEVLGKRLDDVFRCKDSEFFTRLLNSQSGHVTGETEVELANQQTHALKFTVAGSWKDRSLFVVMVSDISGESERAKRLEKEHKKEAVHALIGALMHNFNQILTVIMVKAHLMHIEMEKGLKPAEIDQGLQDIMSLTTQIADLLKNLENTKDFVTEPYLKGIDILDITRSSGRTDGTEEFYMEVVDALLNALDAHEPGARLHARRTSEYAVVLARHMGLNKDETEAAKSCAIVHDVGKIGIPDNILQKPDKLTPNEMEIIRKHSEIGYNLLCHFPFLKRCAEAVYCEHEWYDGRGYPRGLAGNDIPLCARITAVADAFDALRFDRVYRKRLPLESVYDTGGPLESVVSKIKAGSGNQFDPEVFKAFMNCYQELDALFAAGK